MELQELGSRYDERLRCDAYADLDGSVNGLQVGAEPKTIERVAFAVDGVREVIESAIEWDADALVVHHGISWGGIERVTGRQYDRIAPLVRNDIGLYAAHLPLDGHQRLGNAAGVAAVLELREHEPFGQLGPEVIGQRGRLPAACSTQELLELLEPELDTGDADVQVLDFGPDALEAIGIVTGGGADYLEEAIEADLDAFITGEGKQKLYHQAQEAEITVILGGHYATETFGVQSLADLAAEWGLETRMFDCPTGL